MALFPGAIPVAGTASSTATLAAAGHTSLHNTDRDEIRAVATKMGTGASTPAASQVLRSSGAGTSVWGQVNASTDMTGMLPVTNGGTGVTTANDFRQLILPYVYPVGSIYINATDATNPGTLFGFGTWVAWGKGRVPVGFDSTQTEFDTAEETGGEKTHVLTTAEMPAHTHMPDVRFNSNSTHTHSGVGGVAEGANPSAGTASPQATTSTGGDGAHNNLQPYITAYLWKRTA